MPFLYGTIIMPSVSYSPFSFLLSFSSPISMNYDLANIQTAMWNRVSQTRSSFSQHLFESEVCICLPHFRTSTSDHFDTPIVNPTNGGGDDYNAAYQFVICLNTAKERTCSLDICTCSVFGIMCGN